MKKTLSDCLNDTRRVVIKVGSNVLTRSDGLNLSAIASLTEQIHRLIEKGIEVIFVSSGAMASGLRKLGLDKRPVEVPKRQAISAVGQAGLILEYEKSFDRFDHKVAQVLLTSDDLDNRRRYLNARNTLNTLLSWNVIPIINENDTVKVEEIKLGDNDNLSAMITLQMDADILFILTDIDGLYSNDPRTDPDAELIREVEKIGRSIEKIAGEMPGALGTGGMSSKIKAARKVTSAGIPMVIANGCRENVLTDLFSGQPIGTYFVPGNKKLPSRKCWIAFTLKPRGTIKIDQGAADALLRRGKSLLPSGIVDVKGQFGVGESVQFLKEEGDVLGTGLVNYSSKDIRKIMGLNSSKIIDLLGYQPYDEIIHRDNLVITRIPE